MVRVSTRCPFVVMACLLLCNGCTRLVEFHFRNVATDPMSARLESQQDQFSLPPRRVVSRALASRRDRLTVSGPTFGTRSYLLEHPNDHPGVRVERTFSDHYRVMIDERGDAFWASRSWARIAPVPLLDPNGVIDGM